MFALKGINKIRSGKPNAHQPQLATMYSEIRVPIQAYTDRERGSAGFLMAMQYTETTLCIVGVMEQITMITSGVIIQ